MALSPAQRKIFIGLACPRLEEWLDRRKADERHRAGQATARTKLLLSRRPHFGRGRQAAFLGFVKRLICGNFVIRQRVIYQPVEMIGAP